MPREQSQRSAVDLQPLHVKDLQTVTREERHQRRHREIEHVLVVDGVELDVLHEVASVGELEGDPTARLQQRGETGDEAVDVRHVGEDVVAEDEVRLPALRRQFRGELASEEPREGRDTGGHGDLGDVRGRLDAEARHAGGDEVLQQIAVVAGDLDHEALPSEVPVAEMRGRGLRRMP